MYPEMVVCASCQIKELKAAGWVEMEPGAWFDPPNPQPFTRENAYLRMRAVPAAPKTSKEGE